MIEIKKNNKTHAFFENRETDIKKNEEISHMLIKMRENIILNKDNAVIEYLTKFDAINPDTFSLICTTEEIDAAASKVDAQTIRSMKNAYRNIATFHQKQLPDNWSHSPQIGVEYGCQFSAIERVALYVPGGRAVYPSTVLMNAVPAKLAGVKETIVVTPPRPDGSIDPSILVACQICGVNTIIKAGGAQVIFALAYGTESIPKVDKIVGPGNAYVTAAKQMVYGKVDIDKPAGPSEVLVYIEDEKYAVYAASELLAQLEHDPDAKAIAISSSEKCLEKINLEVARQLPLLKRQSILNQSMKNVVLILSNDTDEAIELINAHASEHLVLLVDEYKPLLERIKNGSSIFCGPYTPVTLGDYYAGPNHVLPTDRAARFASPLGVMDFMKYSSFLAYTQSALKDAAPDLEKLTELEGFDGHYNAVSQRIKHNQSDILT